MTTERDMREAPVASEVEVAVDPETAFRVFHEELDLWWVRGPINFYDASRAVARRCEPGVGGRLIEVYDSTTGEGLELGRITAWEPGRRLAWHSSLDDVEIDVRFEGTPAGTRVRVEATVPEGGQDRGGSSWVRVGPPWFGAWCTRRDTTPHVPRDLARLAVSIFYAKPATAARWLVDAFGFEPLGHLPTDDNARSWIEFHVGNGAVMVFKAEGDGAGPTGDGRRRPPTHVPWLFVDDLDAHYARAEARGATIVEHVHQHGYRAYVADDLEGHRWTIAQARPTQT